LLYQLSYPTSRWRMVLHAWLDCQSKFGA